MKNGLRVLVAIVALVCVSGVMAQADFRPAKRVGPEDSVGGVTAEERSLRQSQLYGWLAQERPAGAMDDPILVELTAAELDELGKRGPNGSGPGPLRIGRVKSISPAVTVSGTQRGQLLKRAGGAVELTDDGGFIWSTTVTSPGANAVRVQFRNFNLPANADLYFYSPEGEVRGPYQRQGPNGDGNFWSNSISGDTGIIAIRHFGPFTDEDLRETSFAITDVGHIRRGSPAPHPQSHSWSHDECGNGASCMQDANCGGLGPAGPAADAVAKMEWIKGAFINTCSGGLIADTDNGSQRNLFLTANHCLKSSQSNLETFFDYTTSSCNGNCPGNVSPDTTGAVVLASGRAGDFTLMELSQNPPAGSVFLGWNNSPVAFSGGADLYRVSNPNFGPQVFSRHEVSANSVTCQGWPRGERIYSTDVLGATDGGSSGSPVVNGNSEVVGQLSGCCGYNCGNVCDSGSNWTVDGALAFYYDDVAPFLDPSGGGCTSDSQCDDGQFCNGVETCVDGSCQGGSDPCPGQGCDEGADQCVTCTLLPLGASCSSDGECCSNKCKGPPSNRTCR